MRDEKSPQSPNAWEKKDNHFHHTQSMADHTCNNEAP